jgi:hypothetical protein
MTRKGAAMIKDHLEKAEGIYKKCARRGSNSQPSVPKTDALSS